MKVLNRIKYAAISSLLIPTSAFAQLGPGVDDAAPRTNGKVNVPTSALAWLDTLANVMLFLAGAIAVLVLIYSGIRYVTSTGDATRVKQAKDTMLYAIIGIVVAILAFAIVKFITSTVK